jgi:hypothetical protein
MEQTEQLTPEQARAMLAAERRRRIEACAEEVGAVLAKHRCRAVAVVTIVGGRVESRVEIVAEE